MERQIIVAVDSATTTTITGTFHRHVSPDVNVVGGSPSGGRWGPPGGYSVIYLGRPDRSVVVEAYRHLVDDDPDLEGHMVGPRNLLMCELSVPDVLDLRESASQDAVGLGLDELRSPVGQYAPCQRIGQAAHQLGLRGVIAPAATGLGETLALFEERLTPDQYPRLIETRRWEHLPPDPRRLRLVDEQSA